MTESAIIRGLDWLKANQDPMTAGGKDKDDLRKPKGNGQGRHDGNGPVCLLRHCELQDLPDYGPTVQSTPFLCSTLRQAPGSWQHRFLFRCHSHSCPMRGLYYDENPCLHEYAKRAAIHAIRGQNGERRMGFMGMAKGPLPTRIFRSLVGTFQHQPPL